MGCRSSKRAMAAPLTAAATTTATVSAAAAPSATVAAAAAATVVAATATATAAAGTSAGQAALEQSSLAPADEATVAVPSVTFFLDQKEWTAKMQENKLVPSLGSLLTPSGMVFSSSGPAVALSLKSHIMRTFTLKSQHAFGVWIALQQKSSDTPVGGPTCVFDMNIALGVHGKGKVHDFKGSSGIGFMSTQPIDSFVLAMMAPSPQTDVVYPGFTFAAQTDATTLYKIQEVPGSFTRAS